MNVVPIDPWTDGRWLGFLETDPAASAFYHPAWMRVLVETYGYAPCCLGVEDNGQIVGLLPLMEIESWITGKRGVCLPFSDMCGPLARSNEAYTLLLDALAQERVRRSWKYAEVRTFAEHAGATPAATYKHHRRALTGDAQALYASFNKKRIQWSIQKATSSGVTVERKTDRESLDHFIRLNDLTRQKHGVPPQPASFFHSLQRHLFDAGLGFVSLATVDGVVAAASVWLTYNRILVHKYSASDVRYLKACPNHAVVWDTLKWACANGFSLVDFGRSDLEGEGLIKFKQGWDTEERDLVYARWGGTGEGKKKHSTQMTTRVLSHFPLPILRIAGRVMYRHIG